MNRNGEWGLEKRKKNSDELTLNIQERMLSRIWGGVRIGSRITPKPFTRNVKRNGEWGLEKRKKNSDELTLNIQYHL